MSVLIPSQEQLVYRSCVEEEYYNLLNWFSWVEQRAWDRVNAYFANERPSRIFLVTADTLSPSYAITHKESSSSECEVLLEASVAIPNTLDTNALVQHKIERAYASFGFEEVKASQGSENIPFYTTSILQVQ